MIADVFVTDKSTEGAGDRVREHLKAAGWRGPLHILVANAGISKAAAIEEHTVEDFDNLYATNVRAPFFLVQQLLPLFGDGASIILVSSLGARAWGSAGVRQHLPDDRLANEPD